MAADTGAAKEAMPRRAWRMEPAPMKVPALIVAALVLFATPAHAGPSTTSWVVHHIDSVLDKLGGYLDDAAERRRELDRQRARIAPKGAKPEVIIRRTGIGSSGNPYFADGILYNGQRITTSDPPARAIEVFGPEFRVYENHRIWDKLGIAMYVETPSQFVNGKPKPYYIKSISIELNPPPPGEPASPVEPSHYFSGHLDLDGAGIDRKTKIWEVRALADRSGLAGGHPYIICMQSRTACEVPSLGDQRSDEVSFWTDKDHANGRIYYVTYSFRH